MAALLRLLFLPLMLSSVVVSARHFPPPSPFGDLPILHSPPPPRRSTNCYFPIPGLPDPSYHPPCPPPSAVEEASVEIKVAPRPVPSGPDPIHHSIPAPPPYHPPPVPSQAWWWCARRACTLYILVEQRRTDVSVRSLYRGSISPSLDNKVYFTIPWWTVHRLIMYIGRCYNFFIAWRITSTTPAASLRSHLREILRSSYLFYHDRYQVVHITTGRTWTQSVLKVGLGLITEAWSLPRNTGSMEHKRS
jgi:hypothetical protein